MPKEPDLRTVDLVYFLNGRWQRNIQRLSEPEKSRMERLFDRCDLLECYLWLRLGVMRGAFPADVASHVVEDYSGHLKDTYHAVAGAGADRLFPDHIRPTLKGLELGDKFWEREQNSSPKGRADSGFRAFLLLSENFDDSAARTLMEVVNFGSPKEWKEMMDLVRPPSEIAVMERWVREAWERGAEYRSHLIRALVSVVEYMESFQDLNKETDKDSPPGESRSEFLSPQAWKLNFRDEIVRTRFEQLSQRIVSCLTQTSPSVSREVGRPWDRDELDRLLQMDIRPLMTLWGAPPLATASAR